jgi:protein-S-isoprenylcysteine O-methyltransferase Ste14
VRKTTAAVGSAAFFLLAPGVVAGLIPWSLTGWQVEEPMPYWTPLRVVGLLLLAAGAATLVHSFARFVTEGVGTPAPVAPTEHLVVGGLYRYVRNPIYLALVATILGQALALGQLQLLLYAAGVWALCAAFVRWYEEPLLRRRFGAEYGAYRRDVPAWWPRRPTGRWRRSPGARVGNSR